MEVRDSLAAGWRGLVKSLGYDLGDPHLNESPERVARFMTEWHTMGREPPKLTVFPNEPRVDQLVAVGGFRFYSLCAHHGLPFFGSAAIGYLPRERVLGLSKFARVVDHFAHRFQIQEHLTRQIGEYLEQQLDPIGLGVVIRAEHLCMAMRGVERPGHSTVTSDMRGAFRDRAEARAELFALVG